MKIITCESGSYSRHYAYVLDHIMRDEQRTFCGRNIRGPGSRFQSVRDASKFDASAILNRNFGCKRCVAAYKKAKIKELRLTVAKLKEIGVRPGHPAMLELAELERQQ